MKPLPTLFALAALAPTSLSQTLTVERVASIPQNPTAIAAAPGVAHQLYVATKIGRVWVVRGNQVLGTPALDLRAQVRETGENGMLGLAFHPDFALQRKVYVLYSRVGGFGDTVVSEFTMAPGTVDVIDPASERVILGPLAQTTDGHKAGDIAFGPDGLLYVAIGDGDAGSAANSGIAQDLSSPLGKVLRIDVDAPAPHVPPSNPFVAVAGADPRIYVYGLRNPWRISVDAANGDLYIGDVGASTFEEVTRVTPQQAGANLGWPCREGTQCRQNSACVCPSPTLLDPLLVMPHVQGSPVCAITGGMVLRGSDIPRLEGQFVFTDFCAPNVWMLQDPAGSPTLVDLTPEFDAAHQTQVRFIAELGQGPSGELLLANHYSGELWRVRARPGFQVYCASTPNSTGAASTIGAGGSPSIAAANLTLLVDGLPPGAYGFFVASAGRAYVPGFAGTQGTLCLDLPIHRWSKRVVQADTQGRASLTSDLTDLPWGAVPGVGETWNFQHWTRDLAPGPTSNLSNAVAVTFAP